jgi:hypothetical protein
MQVVDETRRRGREGHESSALIISHEIGTWPEHQDVSKKQRTKHCLADAYLFSWETIQVVDQGRVEEKKETNRSIQGSMSAF